MTRPWRVLYPFVGGDVIGGSHRSALRMISALDPARVQPEILLHGAGGKLGEMIEGMGLSWSRIDRPGIIAPRYSRAPSDVSVGRYLMQSVPGFRRLLRARGIDIVHSNDGRMHGSWALPTRLAGCRFVWHHRQSPDAFGINKIAPLLAHRILSVSQFSHPSRPVRSVEGRFEVIHSPFDAPAQRPDRAACHAALCAEIGAPPDALILGYVGALNTRKRPEHFVRVIAALRAARPDAAIHGLIFGTAERPEDPIAETCRALAQDLGVASALHLMGHRSPIEPAIAGLDALLVTALEEPFGRTLIEAMHLGTPVIATEHGGNPEAITDGKNGFLVDHTDPAAFVAPVLRLCDDPDLAATITACAGRDLDRYGTAAHVRKIHAAYDRVMGQEPNP